MFANSIADEETIGGGDIDDLGDPENFSEAFVRFTDTDTSPVLTDVLGAPTDGELDAFLDGGR